MKRDREKTWRNRHHKDYFNPVGIIAEILPVPLPDTKEALERFFADLFVEQFNKRRPLGDASAICTYPERYIGPGF